MSLRMFDALWRSRPSRPGGPGGPGGPDGLVGPGGTGGRGWSGWHVWRTWRAPGQALRAALGLSPETALWWSPLGVQPLGAPQLPPVTFDAWCAAHPGQRCRLWVAAQALQVVDADASLQLTDAADIQNHVQAQLLHYHGDAALGWPLQVWQDLPCGGASALRGLAVAALRAAARAHRVKLVGVHPGWWWAWAQIKAMDGAENLRGAPSADGAAATGRAPSAAPTTAAPRDLCVLDEGPAAAGGSCATVLVATGAQLHSASIRRYSEIDTPLLQAWCEQGNLPPDASTRVVSVESLRAAPRVATAITARTEAAQADQGPGLLGVAPPSRLSRVAAAAAAVLLATAALDATQVWHLRSSAWLRLADAQAAGQTPVALAPAAVVPRTVQQERAAIADSARSAGLANVAENAATLAWQALLDQPWQQVFVAAEAALVAPVQGLNLSHRGQELRLSVHAPNLQTALSVASTLQRQPGVASAVLERTLPEETGVRAELRAQWAQN